MRLVHLSDLHFGAVRRGLPEALRDAVAAVSPELVVISGDLAQRGRRHELRLARAFLDTLPGPRLVVPGNHDVPPPWRLWARFRHPWQDWRAIVDREIEPVWQSPGLVAAGLNSARPGGWYLDWSRGQVSARQLLRLHDIYARAAPAALRVLVIHHPPAAPPQGTRRHLIDKRPALFGAINQAGVDLILSGHFHMSYAVPVPLPGVQPRSCILSVTSTATSHRLKGEPNGFHVIDTLPGSLLITPFSWDGHRYGAKAPWAFTHDGGDWSVKSPGP